MKKTYKHLTLKERERIDVLRRQGLTVTDIALQLGCNKSTVSRELKRNSSTEYGCYVSSQAQLRSVKRKSIANRHERLKDPRIASYVRQKLIEDDWSPELIAGRILYDLPGLCISHEAIYQYIYSLQLPDRIELVQHLTHSHKFRKRKIAGRKQRKTKIPNRIPIELRPKIVNTRKQPGHWETDSLISRSSAVALNSLTERTTRLLFITKLRRKGSLETARAIITQLRYLPPSLRRTVTMDNGTENAAHELITATLGTKCFFAHPYSSHERGSNEQINGLIRRYLPKKTDFSTISNEHLLYIQNRINNRPRKCLGFKTPVEAASILTVALQH